jgi:hypothetical protein
MKRKLTSYSDMLKTVAAIKHPDVTPDEKHFLLAVALNAGQTGANAYPGMEALAERLDISPKTLARRWQRLVEKGVLLIEPSRRKGIAHVFRFNFAHDAYPDSYIGLHEPPRVLETTDVHPSTKVTDAAQAPSAISTPPIRHSQAAHPSFEHNPSVTLGDGLSHPPSTATSTASILADKTTAAAAADAYIKAQLKQTLRWMKATFVEKTGDNFQHTKEHREQLAVLLADYGSAVVRPVWEQFLLEDRWPARWKFHLKLFNDDFESYLKRIEQTNWSEAPGRARQQTIHLIRMDIFALRIPTEFPEYVATLSAEDFAILAKLEAFVHANPSGMYKMDLGEFGGHVTWIIQRSYAWRTANKELIKQRRREDDEAWIAAHPEDAESWDEPNPRDFTPVAANGSNEE